METFNRRSNGSASSAPTAPAVIVSASSGIVHMAMNLGIIKDIVAIATNSAASMARSGLLAATTQAAQARAADKLNIETI